MSSANHVPLSPVQFLRRTAAIFPDKIGVYDADETAVTYAELRRDADRMADVLRARNTRRGERVGVLSLNNRWMLASHFGVPGAGAVLVAMNSRLSADEYRYILTHSKVQTLFVDPTTVDRLGAKSASDLPAATIVLLPGGDPDTVLPGSLAYDSWIDLPAGDGIQPPESETDMIAVNYTSGTTARPKGVAYSHRGAYLNALAVSLEFGVTVDSRYLWTLPMFHCNGWCFTWGVTAVAATHVCLDTFDATRALHLLTKHEVTHLCGAPVVLTAIARHESLAGTVLARPVRAAVGGAPPAPATVSALEQRGITVTHLYGLTETYGPSLLCLRQPAWDDLDHDDLAQKVSRQGVPTVAVDGARVVDDRLADVPSDGRTLGEIVIRSNTVMLGYLDDPEATSTAFEGGWFHTGDLAVVHPDGYIEIRDRSKDVIISGGENISSVEIEAALISHPQVVEAAVVAAPSERWGERPVAFVSVAEESTSEQELIDHVRSRLAGFKAPDRIYFQALPKTSTGKIQKHLLRDQARALGAGDEGPVSAAGAPEGR